MIFVVTAVHFGDKVEFDVEATEPKEALQKARTEARRIFDYKQGDVSAPKVSVKPVVEKDKD